MDAWLHYYGTAFPYSLKSLGPCTPFLSTHINPPAPQGLAVPHPALESNEVYF